MTNNDNPNPLDDLFSDTPPDTPEPDLDLNDLNLDDSLDPHLPQLSTYHPITGESIDLRDVAQVVRFLIEIKADLQRLHEFENELRKAALALTTGTTKTRRLTAEIDGIARTLIVHVADDEWPERELGALWAWCHKAQDETVQKKFAERFIRAKQVTEYAPVKREIKKLLSETMPEGSTLASLKERLLKINRGNAHKLPSIKVDNEQLSPYEKKRYGSGEDLDDSQDGESGPVVLDLA